jgi:Tfp pilus assembly protein PilX
MSKYRRSRGIALAAIFIIIIIAVVLAVTVVGVTTSQIRYSLKRNCEIATRQAAISGVNDAKYLINGWRNWGSIDPAKMNPLSQAARIIHEPTSAEPYFKYECQLAGTDCCYSVTIQKVSVTDCRVISSGYFKNSSGGHSWEKTISISMHRDVLKPIMINASQGDIGMLSMINSDIGGEIASSVGGKYFTWDTGNSKDSGTRDLIMYKPSSVEWKNPIVEFGHDILLGYLFDSHFGSMTFPKEEAKISDLSLASYDAGDKSIKELSDISENSSSKQRVELEPGKYYSRETQISNCTIIIKNKSRNGAPIYIYLTSKKKSKMSLLDFGDSFTKTGALTNFGAIETNLVNIIGGYEFNAHLNRVQLEFEDPLNPSPVIITGNDPEDFSVSMTRCDGIDASILAKNIFMNQSSVMPSAKFKEQYTGARILAWEER